LWTNKNKGSKELEEEKNDSITQEKMEKVGDPFGKATVGLVLSKRWKERNTIKIGGTGVTTGN